MIRLFAKYYYFIFLFAGLLHAEKIAVATKVKGVSEIMKVGSKNFSSLKAGMILDDGDKVRTGKSGFVAIIFIDDKSTDKSLDIIKDTNDKRIRFKTNKKNLTSLW